MASDGTPSKQPSSFRHVTSLDGRTYIYKAVPPFQFLYGRLHIYVFSIYIYIHIYINLLLQNNNKDIDPCSCQSVASLSIFVHIYDGICMVLFQKPSSLYSSSLEGFRYICIYRKKLPMEVQTIYIYINTIYIYILFYIYNV